MRNRPRFLLTPATAGSRTAGGSAGDPGGDGFAEDSAAVLPPMGQLRLATGIPDSDQPIRHGARAHRSVVEANRLQPHVTKAGPTPHCDQDLVNPEGGAIDVEFDGATVDATEAGISGLRAAATGHLDPKAHVDSALAHRG